MRTTISSIIILVFTILSVSAQTIENKDWFIKTITAKGEKTDYYQHLKFKTDGYVQLEGRVFGRWNFNKKEKTISIESRMVKEFSGIWKIKKLSEKLLVIELNGTELYSEVYDEAKFFSENAKSDLIGLWYITTYDDDKEYYKFEKPNKYSIISASINKAGSNVNRGIWFYDSKDKTLTIPNHRIFISGTNKIKKVDDSEIILKTKNGDKTFTKVTEIKNKNDFMPFKENDNFFLKKGLVENNELLEKYTDAFAESKTNINSDFLKSVKNLMYKKKLYIEQFNTFAEFKFVMKLENGVPSDEYFRNISSSDPEKNNFLFPLKKAGTRDKISTFNDTEITVPAGNFLCQVYHISYRYQQVLLYMIKDKPGVCAKLIVTEKDYSDKINNSIYELTKIEM